MLSPISARQAYDDIVAHIVKQGGPYSSWYCGITSDWKERLFDDHQVPGENHWYIVRRCHNDNDSRAVENTLVELGCDGGSGGGDQSSVYVYAYLKTSATNP